MELNDISSKEQSKLNILLPTYHSYWRWLAFEVDYI